MNKTISINVGGFAFTIEEDAYQKLYTYLNSIKKNFTEDVERDEIMNDIEARIAEIFQSKLTISRQVILNKDVEEMIEIMGLPEDYVSDEFAANNSTAQQSKESNQSQNSTEKRLFRDTENATLGGVCAGLSHYLNIDVTVIRILFIILAIIGGSGILIYLILLFVVPEPKTTSDRMQMHGQTINIESIKEHFQKIKNEIKANAKSGKLKKTFNQTFDKGIKASSGIARTISKIIGFGFVIGGMLALIVLFAVFFGETGLIPLAGTEHTENLSTLLSILYPGSIQGDLVFVAIMIVSLIPVFSIIVSGTKILFNIKQSFKTIAIFSSILWFSGLAILIVTGINLGMSMRAETSVEYEISCSDSSDVLFIYLHEDKIFSDHIVYEDVWNQTELIRMSEGTIFLGYPKLRLTEKRDTGDFEIILHKKSHGLSNQDAIAKAENIDYRIHLEENKLLLQPYFLIKQEDKLRGQEIEVEVKIPTGKKVKLGNNIDRINLEFAYKHKYKEDSFANTTWTAQAHRLVCLECKPVRQIYIP